MAAMCSNGLVSVVPAKLCHSLRHCNSAVLRVCYDVVKVKLRTPDQTQAHDALNIKRLYPSVSLLEIIVGFACALHSRQQVSSCNRQRGPSHPIGGPACFTHK